MFLVKVAYILSVCALMANCKFINKREIGRDTHHKAIGPTVSAEDAYLYRYQVALQRKCGHYCGGTIISNRHILTAAHCVSGRDPRDMTIKAGVTNLEDRNGQIRDVFAVNAHKSYDPVSLHNDIALLTLQEPLDLTRLTVAKLPEVDQNFEGEFIEASGWGGPGGLVNLTYAHFTVKNNSACDHPSHICADPYPNMSTYSGDSGGPIVQRVGNDVFLIALVSGVSGLSQHLFANVAYLRPWIDEAMKAGVATAKIADTWRDQLPKHNC